MVLASNIVEDAYRRGANPDPSLTVSEWADTHRQLSSVSSPEPGQWRTSRTPYLRDIMDALSVSSHYQEIVFMKGSQIGGTEVINNSIGYSIDCSPGPMLYVLPTEQIAKDFSKTRIDPLIEESPALSRKVKKARSRDSGNTTLLKEFDGGFLSMIGANSGAALRGKPIRRLWLDEVDAFPGNVGGEGDPVNLAVVRTRNFSKRRKIFFNSSPLVRGKSRIENLFLNSDQRRYFVPCPSCAHMQIITFQKLKWDTDRPETVRMICEACSEPIYNHDKEEMLANGEWRPTAKTENRLRIGFHLSALYSPVGWFTWEEAVRQFLESKNNREQLQIFINTILGETWEEKGEAEWEQIYYRREDYQRNIIPQRAFVLTAAIDVQKDRIEAEIVAWGRRKESWSIDHRVFPGSHSDPRTWKFVDDMLNESFKHESGIEIPIRLLAADSGYATQDVYNWARKYPISRVIVVKGGPPSMTTMLAPPKAVDVMLNGKKISRSLKVWLVGGSLIKSELYSWLRQPRPEDGDDFPQGYCHFPDYEEEYFKQLAGEYLRSVKSAGGVRWEWSKLRERNEALDLRVYNRAAVCALGMDRWTERTWSEIESQFSQKKEQPVIPAAEKPVTNAQPYRPLSRGVRKDW